MKIVRAWEPRFLYLRSIPPDGQVLDCGSGDFQSTGKLPRSRQDLRWHAVDINPRDQVPAHVTFRCGDLERDKIPYPTGISMPSMRYMWLNMSGIPVTWGRIPESIEAGGACVY
jgi:hypothetical protein